MGKRVIYVYADWLEVKGPQFMGTLTAETVRGKEIEYDKQWLNSPFAQILDPDLQLYTAIKYSLNKLLGRP